MSITAIITAAGNGTRAGFKNNKVLQFLRGDKTVLECAVEPFLRCKDIDEIIITSSKTDYETIKKLFTNCEKSINIVIGGETRADSVKNAVAAAKCEYVLIHDGARPYLSDALLKKCVHALLNYGSCTPVVPCTDTVADIEEVNIISSLKQGKTDGQAQQNFKEENAKNSYIVCSSRQGKANVQTPQGFKTQNLIKAFSLKGKDEIFTDETGLYCKYIQPVYAVDGEKENVKLTYKEDFLPEFKCGTGFDLHKLVVGRKLILGGVEIPHEKGLLGHSDADVLTHAIMDALLSSCSLRDIGYHFSDKDEKYKDISSMILLEKVMKMIKDAGYRPVNVTAVIMAQQPKLSPYIQSISQSLANALELPVDKVGITATTLEGIGIVGREEGIATQAYCSVQKIK